MCIRDSSSSRTARSNSGLLARLTCLRSGLPSGRVPMVTRACQRPSAPRYFEDVVASGGSLRLPGMIAQAGKEPGQLIRLDTDGTTDLQNTQSTVGDLPLDSTTRTAKHRGDVGKSKQNRRCGSRERGGRERGGLHTYQKRRAAPLGVTTDTHNPDNPDWVRRLHTQSVAAHRTGPGLSLLGPLMSPKPLSTGSGLRSASRPIRPLTWDDTRNLGSAPGGIRTPNLLIRSQMLYPLSYGRQTHRRTTHRCPPRTSAKTSRAVRRGASLPAYPLRGKSDPHAGPPATRAAAHPANPPPRPTPTLVRGLTRTGPNAGMPPAHHRDTVVTTAAFGWLPGRHLSSFPPLIRRPKPNRQRAPHGRPRKGRS